jgi:hypothetical protein
MKIKELDNIISEVLEQETKKLIMEQIDGVDHLIDSVKSFQSLSGFLNKIEEIEDAGSDGNVVYISIKGVTPEELVDCCGGTSLEKAQTNLMQGIHHDLEDEGFGGDFDVEVETSGDAKALHLTIRITPNNDKTLSDMKEDKDTNPTVDSKKDVILGGVKPEEVEEQGEEIAVGLMMDKLNDSDDEDNDSGTQSMMKDAATKYITGELGEEEKDNKWIQKAVNPKHKGYCTPMTKSTCTPERKKLAKTFKKMEKNESINKKIITLNETEMSELLNKIIHESVVAPSGGVLPGGVPGIDVTKQAQKESGDENKDALKDVEKRIKEYLSFEGNDNPKFPHQIGKGEDKVATQNTAEEDEVVANERGRGPQDLDYDNEPSKRFKERLKMSLVGASEMGNSPDAVNAIKTDVGDKMHKNIEKRQANKEKEPIYPKEAVPVKTKGVEQEARHKNKNKAVDSDILRMKQMSEYNKKTQ